MSNVRVQVLDRKERPHLVLRWTEPGTRRIREKTAGTSDRREALRVAAQLEAKLVEGQFVQGKRIGWEDFRDRYEDERLAFLAPGTSGPISSILNHLERIARPRYLQDVTVVTLSTLFAKLRKEGLRPTTLNGHCKHLRAAFSWAKQMGLIGEVPEPPRIPVPAGTEMRGRPINFAELAQLLRAVRKERPADAKKWRRLIVGLYLSGLRIEEALKLSWDRGAAISLIESGEFLHVAIAAHAQKRRRHEVLPITPDFQRWLNRRPQQQRVGFVFSIPGRRNVQITGKRAGRVLAFIGRKSGVVVNDASGGTVTAHDLRRSFGTRWAAAGIGFSDLQRIMRHSSVETTKRYYVRHQANEVAERLRSLHLMGMRGGSMLLEPSGEIRITE